MQHSQGTFQGADGTELFYQEWHPAFQARAIVIGVHGHGDHSGGLRSLVDHLVPLNFCWYGFDLRGHGRSPGKRGHVAKWSDFREDLRAFLRHVMTCEPGRRVFLVGHSLGGLICLDYAGMSHIAKVLLQGISHVSPEFALKGRTVNEKLTRDTDVLKALDADELRHESMSAGFWTETDACRRWVRSHPGDLRVPLLLLYGLADRITPARANREFFQSVSVIEKEFREYEETRHRPFDDLNRTEVHGHLVAWLNSRLRVSDRFAPEKRMYPMNRNCTKDHYEIVHEMQVRHACND
jgi:alpha-beta hydrolase superfamily lysophospholipase